MLSEKWECGGSLSFEALVYDIQFMDCLNLLSEKIGNLLWMFNHIIGIFDGEESDIGFFGMRKNYIGWGEAESDIIFPNPKKPYIGRLNIQYCLYSQLFILQ